MINERKIILASKSPRRIELCNKYGIFPVVSPAQVDETLPEGISKPCEIVEYLSLLKAREVAKKCKEDEIIIGADTLVFCGNKILGKPRDKDDAREMMKLLSGKQHIVVSGISVICGEKEVVDSVETKVVFKALTDEETEAYISTDEPYDKAGGYGIQSFGGAFVLSISGDYYNVVGLPVARLLDILGTEFDCFPFRDFLSGEKRENG